MFSPETNGFHDSYWEKSGTLGKWQFSIAILIRGCPSGEKKKTDLPRFHVGGSKAAFPWELLEVFSGPPKVAFTWRHWGELLGVTPMVTGGPP